MLHVRLLACLFVALLASACKSSSIPESTRAGCHPACPGAPQGEIGDPAAVLRGPVPESAAEPAHTPSTAAYLCPMHPWLGADAPGRCPECGMKLVERALVLEHDHDG